MAKELLPLPEFGGTYDRNNNYYFQPAMTLGEFKQTSQSTRTSSNSHYLMSMVLLRVVCDKDDCAPMLSHLVTLVSTLIRDEPPRIRTDVQ